MSNLSQIVHRGKHLRKSLGKQMKGLRKKAKRVIYDDGGLEEEEVLESLRRFRAQLKEILNLEATRTDMDADQRVDLVVGGEVLVADISMAKLLVLRQEVKYHQKLYRRLNQAMEKEDVEVLAQRLEGLRDGVEAAIATINTHPVDARASLGEKVDAYLFEGIEL